MPRTTFRFLAVSIASCSTHFLQSGDSGSRYEGVRAERDPGVARHVLMPAVIADVFVEYPLPSPTPKDEYG
jgi:hypothetical protein